MTRLRGHLALASGKAYAGWIFGAAPESASRTPGGEVVFNTSLTGYQEILTDPSYEGQIVVMTPSHIGNTGVNGQDVESARIFLSGFVVQEVSRRVSNWRASTSLMDYLANAGVTGLSGVDTRALTRHLREQGAVNGLIGTGAPEELIKKAKALPGLEGRDLVQNVSAAEQYGWTEGTEDGFKTYKAAAPGKKRRIVVIDFGVKRNILRCLVERGCDVTVVPANTPAETIVGLKPDGVLLSNGPGDPAAVTYGVRTARSLVDHVADQAKKGDKPTSVFGICLGHQIMGLALGGRTYKLKFGHHGANHPIKDLTTGQVDITSQNHGFAVEGEQAGGQWVVKGNKDVLVTHLNLNDQSVEGLRHAKLPVFSVQYHPEASAGPHDAEHLFDRFLKSIDEGKN